MDSYIPAADDVHMQIEEHLVIARVI